MTDDSNAAKQRLEVALAHHRAGRLDKAEYGYRRVLDAAPQHPQALHMLGVLAHQSGKLDIAVDFMERALAADPSSALIKQSVATALASRANALRREGRLAEAEAQYKRVVELAPADLNTLFNLASLLIERGNHPAAEPLLRRFLNGQPADAEASFLLGEVLARQRKNEEATQFYERATELKPDYVEAWNNWAVALKELGKLKEAEQACRRALSVDPRHAESHATLGAVLKDLCRIPEALEACRQAIALNPRLVQAHNNLGAAQSELNDEAGAEESYRRAIRLDARNAESHYNLGALLASQRKWAEAIASFKQAIDARPRYVDAYNILVLTLREIGLVDEAEAVCREGLAREPTSAKLHCAFALVLTDRGLFAEAEEECRAAIALDASNASGYSLLANQLCNQARHDEARAIFRRAQELDSSSADVASGMIFCMDLADNISVEELQAERKRWYAKYAQPHAERYAHLIPPPAVRLPRPGDKIRVGYVSGDFRDHSATYIFLPMLTKFDPAKFEVFCYSNARLEDRVSTVIQSHVTAWRRIHQLSDDKAVAMIQEDGVDILVDLSSHTAGTRLGIFAFKPAPVQVTAWGYATGTGMATMDYFFADPVLVPQEHRRFFAENIFDLDCCVCYEPPAYLPPVSPLPLKRGGRPVVFGCYNRLTKLSPRIVALWGRILGQVPGATLALKALTTFEGQTREKLIERFAALGVPQDRLLLLAKSSHAEHLLSYGDIDVVLDPYPHGGGISTMEPLWMGVPVVTLQGDTTVSRLSASILTAAGLADWIATTEEQYVEKAVSFARNWDGLVELRRTLRAKMAASPVGDIERYVRRVEAAYQTMLERHRETRGAAQASRA